MASRIITSRGADEICIVWAPVPYPISQLEPNYQIVFRKNRASLSMDGAESLKWPPANIATKGWILGVDNNAALQGCLAFKIYPLVTMETKCNPFQVPGPVQLEVKCCTTRDDPVLCHFQCWKSVFPRVLLNTTCIFASVYQLPLNSCFIFGFWTFVRKNWYR